MRMKPTATFAGKPTAKTLSCGTTRETMPKAASVITSAISTGAQIWMAAVKMPANEACMAATRPPSWGESTSGTSSYVRARPCMTQASPLIAMNTMTPTRL